MIKKIILLVLFIVIWCISSQYVSELFIPSPFSVLTAIQDAFVNGMLLNSVLYSFARLTIATLLSASIAVPMGLAMYNSRHINDVMKPIVSAMRFIPITAFYPLLIMWFGIDETMKLSFLFLATFVYMLPSVILCLNEVNKDLIDTGITIGMSKLQTIYKIMLPAALPSMLESIVMMYGIGWTYIVVAETINAKYGLGYMINLSSARGRTDIVFGCIIVVMVISILFDFVCNKIIKKSFKWRYVKENDKIK